MAIIVKHAISPSCSCISSDVILFSIIRVGDTNYSNYVIYMASTNDIVYCHHIDIAITMLL